MDDNIYGNDRIINTDLKDEVEKDFLEYAMSVIVSRALPDLRDGLKPVHRRILYAMNDLKITHDTAHKKSARIVGEVIGKYHPHGDSSVYEAMVRMSQDFAYRYPLIDGHGNFGSIDGDGAAAMRYTEARLSKISSLLLKDIDMETVPFVDNYDGSETEPKYLTGYFPNLLVNGTTGIAVGMATNIPPHNLREVISAIKEYINDENIDIDKILEHIKGPDFPTGASSTAGKSMIDGYKIGKGSVTIRSKIHIEEKNKKNMIVVTEIPYQSNKVKIIEKIAELHKNKVIDGILDIRDESNYEGIRMVIELNKDSNPNLVINKLYKFTSLQSTFSINMLSLNNGIPVVLNIKDIIKNYVKHQIEMIINRSIYEKTKLEKKLHILLALSKALENIELIIKIIKESESNREVFKKMYDSFGFDEVQSKAILDMRLQRLVGLERAKIEEDIRTTKNRIEELLKILNSKEVQKNVLIEQLDDIYKKFGDDRRTVIINDKDININDEELIQDEQVLLTLSDGGYFRRLDLKEFKTQKRAGKGSLITSNSEDTIINAQIGKIKDDLLMFSNSGKVYRIKPYLIPKNSKTSKGMPIVNFIGISNDEKITSILFFKNKKNKFKNFLFLTKKGIMKRVDISEFIKINSMGKVAINLDEGDQLVSVIQTTGDEDILISTHNGKIIRIKESEAKTMSRSSRGIKAISLSEDDWVISSCSDLGNEVIATISKNGLMKKTLISEYNVSNRGTKGVAAMEINEKTGKLAFISGVREKDSLLAISSKGKIIKINMSEINLQSRRTTGVKGFNMEKDETITTVAIEYNKGDKNVKH